MQKAANQDLLNRVELLSKGKDEKEEAHDAAITEVIAEVKANFSMTVQEAKIKLAEDVANTGSQNLDGQCAALDKLKGEPINTSQDPEGKQLKEDEEDKTSGNDDQATFYASQIKIFYMILYKTIFVSRGLDLRRPL